MVRIWNIDGLRIYATGINEVAGENVGIEGFIHAKGQTEKRWTAWAAPQGWMVRVRGLTGREETFQGSTFNLELEVASAARRAQV